MKALIVIFGLVILSSGLKLVEYQTGRAESISFNTGHIFERQTAVPRSQEFVVTFPKEFQKVPNIAHTVYLLDWAAGLPQGYRTEIVDKSTKNFKLKITAVAPLPLYTVVTQWFAFTDPHIQVFNGVVENLPALKTGTGPRQMTFDVTYNFPGAATAIPLLTSVKHITTNPIIELVVEKGAVSATKTVLTFKTYWEAQAEMIGYSLIVGTVESLWVSPQWRFFGGTTPNHPMFKREPGAAKVNYKIEVPAAFQHKVGILGFSGYDVERARNFRLAVGPWALTDAFNVEIQTWWDSFVYGVFTNHAAYNYPAGGVQFETECAEIFEECDFKGKSLIICDKNNNFDKEGFKNPVKSLTVPEGKALLLHDKENLEGKTARFTSNQACLKGITFQFVQLYDKPLLRHQ